MIIVMPEEYKNREYEIKEFVPKQVLDKITRAQTIDKDPVKAENEALKGLVIKPKIDDAFLEANTTDGIEMSLLAETIMKELKLTPERLEELKKKVQKR